MEAQSKLAERILDQVADAVICTNHSGAIVRWNPACTGLFGYSAEEALGKNLDLIIPERQRQRHWDGYEKVMETGVTRYGKELLAVPALRKDGTRISLEFSIVLVRDDAGSPQGVAAIMRDVTARRQQEQEIKQRLASLEAK